MELSLSENNTAFHFAEIILKNGNTYRYFDVYYIRLLDGNRLGFYNQDNMPLSEHNGQYISDIKLLTTSKSFFTFDIKLLEGKYVHHELPATFELTFDEKLKRDNVYSMVAYSTIDGNQCLLNGVTKVDYSEIDNHIWLNTDKKVISLALNDLKKLFLPKSILSFDHCILINQATEVLEPQKSLVMGNIKIERGN